MLDIFTMDLSLDLVAIVGEGKGKINSLQQSCFYSFLTGILLWDTISMPSDEYIDSRFMELKGDSLTADLLNLITFIDTPQFDSFGPVLEKNELVLWRKSRAYEEFIDKIETSLIERTGMYEKISLDEDLAYLPCRWRIDYFKNNYQHDIITRESLLRQLEHDVAGYAKSTIMSFRNPLLIDFIQKKAGDAPREQLLRAFELRHDADVVSLRNSLNRLEEVYKPDSINHGEIILAEVNEISNDVFRKFYPGRSDVAFGGSATFGLFDGLKVGLNLNTPIRRNTGKRYLDKKFIRRLLEFGLNERKRTNFFA